MPALTASRPALVLNTRIKIQNEVFIVFIMKYCLKLLILNRKKKTKFLKLSKEFVKVINRFRKS